MTTGKQISEKVADSNSTSSMISSSLTNTSSSNSFTPITNESNLKWKKQADDIKVLLAKSDSKTLFSDPFFQTDDPNNDINNNKLEWLRPREICKSPILGVNASKYDDVLQSSLDNCGFVAACSSIIKYPYLISQIFSNEIDFNDKNYRGFVSVNFFFNNDWITVCIDDRLPTVNKKLIYSKCKNEAHFWVALLEKAFAKIKGSYKSLVSIDSANVLVNLTGGFVLRLNPTNINDRETILNYMNECAQNDLFVGIAGCELIKNDNTQQVTLKNPSGDDSSKPNIGHAFSIVDSIYIQDKNKAFLKVYNPQSNMKLSRKYNENDRTILEQFLKTRLSNESDSIYLTYEEFFEFFEILNLLVIPKDKLPDGHDLTFVGKWEDKNNLVVSRHSSLIEKYLNSPHFVFEIQHDDKKSNEQIVLIMNIMIENFTEADYIGYFILPVCNRKNLEAPESNFYFVNYTIQNQSLSNMNPLTKEMKLLPGRYLFGLIIQSNNLKECKSKQFNLRIATALNTTINQQSFKQMNINENNYLIIEKTKERIKLVLAKCSVCEFILDANYVTSGAKTFCTKCYNAAFRCEKCNGEVGKEYYTIEQRIYCEKCLENFG